jgi:phosphatidylglycerophosphatase A
VPGLVQLGDQRAVERRFKGGFGVMIDDMLAAAYTLLVLAVAWRIISL